MISLELLFLLQAIGILSLFYSLITTEAYLWRVIVQVISATVFMFVGVQLFVLISFYVGFVYLCLALLVMLIAFVDYINTAEMAIELKKEVKFTQ